MRAWKPGDKVRINPDGEYAGEKGNKWRGIIGVLVEEIDDSRRLWRTEILPESPRKYQGYKKDGKDLENFYESWLELLESKEESNSEMGKRIKYWESL